MHQHYKQHQMILLAPSHQMLVCFFAISLTILTIVPFSFSNHPILAPSTNILQTPTASYHHHYHASALQTASDDTTCTITSDAGVFFCHITHHSHHRTILILKPFDP